MKNQTASVLREPDPAVRDVAPPREVEEAPPFLGSWRNVYLFVLGELALTVVAFYALTRWMS